MARGSSSISRPPAPLDPDALRSVDLLVVNEHEADWLAAHLGAGADGAARGARRHVVRTLGERGAAFAGPAAAERSQPCRSRPSDTTAAGDCFTGVLAAALDRGLALPDALRRASLAAGLCCARRGSQASLPERAEIDTADLKARQPP